jgi:hypothetical protein
LSSPPLAIAGDSVALMTIAGMAAVNEARIVPRTTMPAPFLVRFNIVSLPSSAAQ